MTGTGQASCFDITTSTMDVQDAACKHVAVADDGRCPYDTLVVDPRDYENERSDDARGSLLDLLDDWGSGAGRGRRRRGDVADVLRVRRGVPGLRRG